MVITGQIFIVMLSVAAQPRLSVALKTSAVPAAFPPTPELAARRWLAARAGAWRAPRMGELRVDALTGAVLVDEEHVVPGLYSAVPVAGGPAGGAGRDAASLAGRAGYGAVIMTQSWAHQGLSSVG